jgi:4'-phosphopantetheinyl transferase
MLLKEWKPTAHSAAAIWKIEEPEDFFREHTGLDADMKNEKRRIERLAGRYLLRHLQKDFPIEEIYKDQHDKPRLENNKFYFSISHSWPYVAAIIDNRHEAGIDIQTWHPRIGQLQYKFLSPSEQQLFGNDPQLLTLAWSAKEAAYKWVGRRGVDFIGHLPIHNFQKSGKIYKMSILNNLFENKELIFIESIITIDFSCSCVVIS